MKENPKRKIGATQGRQQRHHSIGHKRLPIRLSYKLCAYLVTFLKRSELLHSRREQHEAM